MVFSGSMVNQVTSEISINNATKGLYVLSIESYHREKELFKEDQHPENTR